MRIIDADALGVGKAKREAFDNPAYADGWNSAIEIIDNAPTLALDDVIPHGRWLSPKTPKGSAVILCSECKKSADWGYNYCPNCGAKMELEE